MLRLEVGVVAARKAFGIAQNVVDEAGAKCRGTSPFLITYPVNRRILRREG